MTGPELADVIRRLLRSGCPTPIIADALDVPVAAVREVYRQLNIQRTGADNMTEALQMAQWNSIAEIVYQQRFGPPGVRKEIAKMLFKYAASAAMKQTPQEISEMQEEVIRLGQLFKEQITLDAEEATEGVFNEFVAVVGDADDQG